MKQIFISLFVVMALALTSCGGAAKDATKEEGKTEGTEVKTEVKAEGDLLAKYEVLVNKSIEIATKIKGGDTAAAAEYQKLSEEMVKFAQDNQEALSKLTAADQAKFQEIATKAAAAMQ